MSEITNSLLSELSDAEKNEVLKILDELSNQGSSKSYNDFLYKDYEEIPVDIETFLRNPRYLGKGLVDETGRFTVYHYWLETLKKIFPDPLQPSQYHTVALTGAIGLGKSFMGVLIGLYELYRMLCLKDPYLYYGLQPIDKITFALMNITIDASKGVAWDKMQQLLLTSEWFLEHGTVSGTVYKEWSPNKRIELIAGSLTAHILGRAVFFCLDGDTEIITDDGLYSLKELSDNNKLIKVYNITEYGNLELSTDCFVAPTLETNEEIQIELEDGSTIKCTPNHRLMLKDGTYKEAQYLTEEDELFDIDIKQGAQV